MSLLRWACPQNTCNVPSAPCKSEPRGPRSLLGRLSDRPSHGLNNHFSNELARERQRLSVCSLPTPDASSLRAGQAEGPRASALGATAKQNKPRFTEWGTLSRNTGVGVTNDGAAMGHRTRPTSTHPLAPTQHHIVTSRGRGHAKFLLSVFSLDGYFCSCLWPGQDKNEREGRNQIHSG